MIRRTLLLLAGLPAFLAAARPAIDAESPPFAAWSEETLAAIEERYHLPGNGLYAASLGGSEPDHAWAMGVQLSALAAAARMDAKHQPALERLIAAMEAYWRTDGDGLAGYDATAFTAKLDRYYDDNAWIALALIEAYEATGDPRHLDRARATIAFTLSGEDDALGGGIWWHEQTRETKNTCVAAPTIVALLRLSRHVEDPSLRAGALRLRAWTRSRLQDPRDGLFWDNISRSGEIDRRKFTYNTGLMIRAELLLAATAAEEDAGQFVEEAVRMARAAEAKWVDAKTGAIRDGGRFAHLLAEAFVERGDATGDAHWREAAERAVTYVHEHTRGPDGSYSDGWNRPPAQGERAELIAQASAARIFARLAIPPPHALASERERARPR